MNTGIERMVSLNEEEEREFRRMLCKMYGEENNAFLTNILNCSIGADKTVSWVVCFGLMKLDWLKVQDDIEAFDHHSSLFWAEQKLSEPDD